MIRVDIGRLLVIGRGEWSKAAAYERLDVVTHGGSSYMALRDTSSEPPGDDWQLVASKGDPFAYDDFTEEQIEGLAKPAADAAAKAELAIGKVDEEHAKLKALDDRYDAQVKSQGEAFTEAEAARAGESKRAVSAADSAAKAANDSASSADAAASSANNAAQRVETAVANAESATASANAAAGKATSSSEAADKSAKSADSSASEASSAAADARLAAEEARGSVSADRKIYYTYETVGDTEYLTLVDTEES